MNKSVEGLFDRGIAIVAIKALQSMQKGRTYEQAFNMCAGYGKDTHDVEAVERGRAQIPDTREFEKPSTMEF